MKTKEKYTILLKDGKTVNVWFLGKELEMILKNYNIPYVKKGK